MQHVPLWKGSLTRENYAHKYDLTSVPTAGTPDNLYDMDISGGYYDED